MASAGGALSGAASGASLGSVVPGIGTALGAIGGGLIGLFSSSGDRDKADAAMRAAMNELNAVGLPPDQSAPIIMKHFQQAGILTPEVEKAIDVGVSKVSQIQEDPRLKDAQMKALGDIQKVSSSGLRPEDRAALAQIRQSAQRDAEAKRQQIIQSLQSRGLAGGGSELATQLAASQQGAESENMAGMNIAAQASQRALDAMRQAGTLGSQIRGQEFDISKTKAGAEDELNRFNVQNQINQQARNVGRAQEAQQYNVSTGQRMSDLNTQQANQESLRQKEAQRQYYLDKLNLAKAKASAYTGQAQDSKEEAARKQQSWGQMGAAGGALLGSVLGKKTDDGIKIGQEEEVDLDDMDKEPNIAPRPY